MPIASLAPGNSKKARTTAVNSCTTFLATEDMDLPGAFQLIDADKTGKLLGIMLVRIFTS
ncbi:hypothetical protein PC116_g14123 [Phytophthora cactorum]|nr:hypothetical protein PC114_g12977 [Phytophthora cactorum]KAG3195214.1 hypothetical protein PC128_g8680 [Phytophthora cactorum]KAG4237822.1 hypothetical protein PC116_g14123 [Phytophthora cactorum]